MLAPCTSIHTFFMQFPIDVLFVGRDGRVLKVQRSIGAWRLAAAWRAFAVVELAIGAIDQSETQVGDLLEVELR